MTRIRRPSSPGAPADAAPGRADALEAALLRACDSGAGAEPIERALLEYVVHPHGLGADEALLLVHAAAAATLHPWAIARRTTTPTLEAALDPSRPSSLDRDCQDRTARIRQRAFDPEALDRVACDAWISGRVTAGVADGRSDLWIEGVPLMAITLHCVDGAAGLLVAIGVRGDHDAAAERLDRAARAASAALSIERRAREERMRAQRAAALAEMTQACVSAMNVAEALHLATRLAVRVCVARGSAGWRLHGDQLRLEVTHGPAGQRERVARELGAAARDAVEAMSRRRVEPVAPGGEQAAIVPLVAFGRPLGALAAWERTALRPDEAAEFTTADLEFLQTLGDLLALVLDQAARFDALRAAEREREELRARVRREERLAAAGEMAARAAREVRNPIASIAAFARRAHREMKPDDPLREYLEVVMREVDRIDRITREQVALGQPSPPRLKVESLNAIVGRALQGGGEALVRRRIRLLKKLAADLPELLLDAPRIEHVVRNILDQAVDAVPLGGRIRVETRRVGTFVVLETAHDGRQDPGAMMEELFAPFAPSRASGGVGLPVARQIIRDHGGEIRVRADLEWSTVVTLTFPVLDNNDRRRPGADRRMPRRDRRRTADPA